MHHMNTFFGKMKVNIGWSVVNDISAKYKALVIIVFVEADISGRSS